MLKVIYHHPCSDGFCAAYILWTKYPDAEFIPMNYGKEFDLSTFGSEDTVFIVDFSFKRSVILDLAGRVLNLTVLDHHKTAAAELSGDNWPENTIIEFDMSRSGAMMTWDFIYSGKECPLLVEYVQDRDLWKFDLPDSRAVNEYIKMCPFDFKAWKLLDYKLSNYLKNSIEYGTIALDKINQQVNKSVEVAKKAKLGIHTVFAVNTTVNLSEVAGLLGKHGIGLAWWFDGVKYHYSLRSSCVDVSEIAKEYGGGGHAAAAGFESDTFLLDEEVIRNPYLGKVVKIDDGYVYVWSYDPCCRQTSVSPQARTGKMYVCFECDSRGYREKNIKKYISATDMERYIHDQDRIIH